MTQYRRSRTPGATWFFTVNLAERRDNTRLTDNIDALRQAFTQVRTRHPFRTEAIVVLPDHLHCIWQLPPGDADYGMRWGLIKAGFSRSLQAIERISASRRKRGERGIWQRRFWEHQIRDESDFERHADYIHYNPVKHRHAPTPAAWPYSTFQTFVARGICPIGPARPFRFHSRGNVPRRMR
jgi:putative transposase